MTGASQEKIVQTRDEQQAITPLMALYNAPALIPEKDPMTGGVPMLDVPLADKYGWRTRWSVTRPAATIRRV